MKKLYLSKAISVILSMAIIFVLLPTVSLTANALTEGNYEYETINGMAIVTKYIGSEETVTIPSTLGGYPVVGIGNYAFETCLTLSSVYIPEGVIKIGIGAFYYCMDLIQVSIPNSMINIDDHAFRLCSLLNVYIPENVNYIGDYAFAQCSYIESFNVNENNKFYASQDGALFNKSKTTLLQYAAYNRNTEYTVPANVTKINDLAFSRCQHLENINVDINNSEYSSENGVLFNKAKTVLIQYPLRKPKGPYTIPNTVKMINNNAFELCPITDIIIPGSVIDIGNDAFGGCMGLTSVTIPDSVVNIGEKVFFGCLFLTNVSVGKNVESIGVGAFAYCFNLININIPKSVTSIDGRAFEGCQNLNIYCCENSYAHMYAIEKHISFSLIADNFVPGDVNNDSDINIFDIMLIRDHIFGKNTLLDDAFTAADVNGDEDVNIFDIMAIRDYIFGKVTEL